MPTVLVVDDEQHIRDVLQEMLEDEGYTVETASDGARALLGIREFSPDLVILDGAMPVMSGEDLLKELRASDFSLLPIIMLTANRYPERYLAYGANAAMAKPFAIEDLLQLVVSLLNSPEKGSTQHT